MHPDTRVTAFMAAFLFLSLSVQGSMASASSEGLLAYWGFNETSGATAHDSSGNNNDGAIYGATRVAGKSGNALQFDGTNDYVGIPSIVPSPREGTIEAWVKPDDATGKGMLIVYMGPAKSTADGWGDEEEMHLDIDDNIFEFYFGSMKTNNNSWFPDPPRHEPGVWYFVAATYKNGDFARLYLNGVLVGAFEEDKNISTATWSEPTLIGRPRADKRYFGGALDEIRIYNRALTQEEILADMGSGGGPDTLPPMITVGSPRENATYTTPWVPANITLDENGSWCSVSLNRGVNQTMLNSSGTFWYLNVSVPANGPNNITFFCSDASGNVGGTPPVNFIVNATPLAHDVSLSGLSLPGTAAEGASVSVSATITDRGTSSEDNVPVIFSVDGISLQSQYFNLSSGENKTAGFTWTAVAGNHNIAVFANLSADENPADNTVAGTISVSPGSGGGGGGGYYYYSSPSSGANNRNANFSNLSIPDRVKRGEELIATGCVKSLGVNASMQIFVDGTLRDSEPVLPPEACFTLTGGILATGSRIVSVSLSGSSLAANKVVTVWEPPKPTIDMLGISAPDSVFTGTPVKLLVFVDANMPQEVTVDLESDGESIGRNTSAASGKTAIMFIHTFSTPGNKTLEAVASTGTVTDMASRKIEVRGKAITTGSPTGMLISTRGAALLIIMLAIALLVAWRILKGKKAAPPKNEGTEV